MGLFYQTSIGMAFAFNHLKWMQMKQFFSLLLLLSSLHSAISDFKNDDYQLLIGKNFNDEAFDIVEDYDYNISVIGYTQDYKSKITKNNSYHNAFEYLSSIKRGNSEQLRLIKLNPSAVIVNDINIKLDDLNRGSNIIKTEDNGYLVGGYTHSGQMFISHLDSLGDSYYVKLFGTANFDKLYSLIALKDGSYLAIGTSQTSRNKDDNIFVQGLGESDIYLVKFEPNGNIIWKKKYGSIKKDIGVDGVATDDGGFILLELTQEDTGSKIMLAKINDTGDASWIKTFPKSGQQKAFKIIQTTDKNYLISASFENKNNQDNIRLIKIDNKGDVLWEKNYFKNANEALNDISYDFQGNFIGVGYSQSTSKADKDALVRYYDQNGNMLWEKKFGKDRQDSFKTVTLLHDNTFAIAGFSSSFTNKKRQIWIIKLHNDGSLVSKKFKTYNTLYEALKTEFKGDLSVKIYKDLRIAHKGLVFKQGSSSLISKHKKILKDFIPHLIKVLSQYKDQIKNIRINGYTSTEWNAPSTQRYLKNARLSNERAMNILDYSYSLDKLKKDHKWLSQKLSTDGYSYSNLIMSDKKENKIRSRRVEFQIIVK